MHDNLVLLPRRFSRARIPGSLSLSLHSSTVYRVRIRTCSSSRCIMTSAKARPGQGGETDDGDAGPTETCRVGLPQPSTSTIGGTAQRRNWGIDASNCRIFMESSSHFVRQVPLLLQLLRHWGGSPAGSKSWMARGVDGGGSCSLPDFLPTPPSIHPLTNPTNDQRRKCFSSAHNLQFVGV